MERCKFVVEMNLDPVEGSLHEPEQAMRWLLQGLLNGAAGHYNPTVRIFEDQLPIGTEGVGLDALERKERLLNNVRAMLVEGELEATQGVKFIQALGGDLGGQVTGIHWVCADCDEYGMHGDPALALYIHRQEAHVVPTSE